MSLFQLIRLVLAGLAALVLFLLLRKKLKQRTAIILAVAVFAAADVLLCNTPLENAVYTFPTPKAAADYVGFGDVTDVVEGEESALFLTGGSGQYQLRVFPKAADGWKLCGENGTDIKGFFSGEDTAIQLVQMKNSTEYYVVVICTGGNAEVTDSYGSVFRTLQAGDGVTSDSIYLAYVPGYDAQYVLTVNGETISLG